MVQGSGREHPLGHRGQQVGLDSPWASPILVTGGTGTLGRHVARRLREAGHDVRVFTRRTQSDQNGVRFFTGDLFENVGIEPAVDGVAAIVHCAGSYKGDAPATRNLVRAASSLAGAPHMIHISVVGADRIPATGRIDRTLFAYFGSKLETERVVAGSGLPWTMLRATQFYDLVLSVAVALARLPVVPVPAGWRFQPVDADEVAARLVELTFEPPAGLVADIAGPRICGAAELLRAYLRASHRRRPIVPIWLPGEGARAVRAGATLAPDCGVGHRTWEEFLAGRASESGIRRASAKLGHARA